MTITSIAFQNGTPLVDIVVDADLQKLHPDMTNNLWAGKENYRVTIQQAYDQVIFDLGTAGFSAALISNSTGNISWVKRVVSFMALLMIFRDFRSETGDRWDLLIDDYQKMYDKAIQSPVLDYDTDESGTIDEDEEDTEGEQELVR